MLHWDWDHAGLIPKTSGRGLDLRVHTSADGESWGRKYFPTTQKPCKCTTVLFQKEPREYLGKHRKRYEMSHAFPAGVDQQGEAKGTQASRQPRLRLAQVLLLVVGRHGHLLCPPRHGACIPLASGAV